MCTQTIAPSCFFQTLAPIKTGDLVLLTSMVFYVMNQSRALSVLDYTDFMGRTQWKIYHDQKNATGREQTRGVLSRPGILEHSTKGMISKHEKSSLVRIRLAYKMRALTPLFLKPSARKHRRGRRMIVWNRKSGN